jgi:hypothetical protein
MRHRPATEEEIELFNDFINAGGGAYPPPEFNFYFLCAKSDYLVIDDGTNTWLIADPDDPFGVKNMTTWDGEISAWVKPPAPREASAIWDFIASNTSKN